MKKLFTAFIFILVMSAIAGCSGETEKGKKPMKVGIMLSDVGLGDQSFSDAGFAGLEKARDELGILFDYKELSETKSYENGLRQLAKEGNDIVIGLGFMVQEPMEKVAKEFPKQKFLLIDSQSKLENVYTINFKEEQGSYLVGYLAAMKSSTDTIGFIGGMDVPLIRKFAAGFLEGAKAADPNTKVIIQYAGDFGKPEIGAKLAADMIDQGADYLYPAAGLTGLGVLNTAQEKQVYSFGVDSDQYFLAEKSVVSSMVKKIDHSIYSSIQDLQKGKLTKRAELGLKENGVGMADIRIISLSEEEKSKLEEMKKSIESGKINVPTDY
ncbi:BMP family protein [Fictibacillus iocasae]|uniref:BMP family protein n=1 Tax=Fictibacillus iocasae TaxID=2715437 RepID=A0ABW2NZD2_9BACL